MSIHSMFYFYFCRRSKEQDGLLSHGSQYNPRIKVLKFSRWNHWSSDRPYLALKDIILPSQKYDLIYLVII